MFRNFEVVFESDQDVHVHVVHTRSVQAAQIISVLSSFFFCQRTMFDLSITVHSLNRSYLLYSFTNRAKYEALEAPDICLDTFT